MGDVKSNYRYICIAYFILLALICGLEIYECLKLKSSCLLSYDGHESPTPLPTKETKNLHVYCKTFPLDRSGSNQLTVRGCNNREGYVQLYICRRPVVSNEECPVVVGRNQCRRLHMDITDALELSVQERQGKCLPLNSLNSTVCFNTHGRLTNFTIYLNSKLYTLNPSELVRLHALIGILFL